MESHHISAGGVRLYVATAGHFADPPLLLLHGWPESHRGWLPVCPLLAGEFFLIMPDQRGFGRSDLPTGTDAYRMRPLVTDAAAVLDHFDIGKAGVVGHDFGGIVAWALGALAPQRVSRMTVLCAPHPMRFREAALADRRQLAIGFYAWLMNVGDAGERLLASRGFQDLSDWAFGSSPGVDEDLRAAYRKEWSRPGVFHAMAEWYRANYPPDLVNPDVSFRLPSVKVPVRYIHGEKDAAFIPAMATGSGSWVDAEYDEQMITGGSHWVVHEQPRLVADLIREWMGRQ